MPPGLPPYPAPRAAFALKVAILSGGTPIPWAACARVKARPRTTRKKLFDDRYKNFPGNMIILKPNPKLW